MKKFITLLVVVGLFLMVWLWIIPAKIKSDQDGHTKYLDKQGYEMVERVKVRVWTYSAFYSVRDKETGETDTLEVRYSRNGAYSIVY